MSAPELSRIRLMLVCNDLFSGRKQQPLQYRVHQTPQGVYQVRHPPADERLKRSAYWFPLKEKHHIVSVGANSEVHWLRDEVLRTNGFIVFATSDEQAALSRIKQGECQTLLLYYRLPRGVGERLAAAVREYCPGAKVLVLAVSRMQKPDFADDLLYTIEGTESVIEAIKNH